MRIQKGEGDGEAASRDLQQVHTTVAVNYHLKPEQVAITFREVGDLSAVASRLTLPAVQEAVKASIARYTAEELVTKREEVRDAIRSALIERVGKLGVNMKEPLAARGGAGALAGQTYVVTGTLPTLSREGATRLILPLGALQGQYRAKAPPPQLRPHPNLVPSRGPRTTPRPTLVTARPGHRESKYRASSCFSPGRDSK